MSVFSLSVVFWLLVISQARETGRSKRQSTVYYLCGSYPNQYVSQQPCAGSSAYTPSSRLNNNNNYYYTAQAVLPASFTQPSSFCNRGCNTLNCNQYQGQWLGSQFVATNNHNQYSACASSCCRNNYAYNPLSSASIPAIGQGVSVGGYGYNYNSIGNGVGVNTIGNGVGVNTIGNGVGVNTIGNGVGPRYPFGVMQYCGGIEQPSATCQNGVCPNGDVCTPGNVCCKCSVGSAAGPCVNNDCPAGYSCQQNNYCCATFVYNDGYKLNMCVNGACNPGFTCGKGGLCYPDTPTI